VVRIGSPPLVGYTNWSVYHCGVEGLGVLDSVSAAVDALGRGEFVIVVDDEDRENEGDLVLAAEHATPDKIAFMVRHTSGLLCVPTTGERLDRLGLPLMVSENSDRHATAFTVS